MSAWKRNFASSEVSVNVFVYVSVSGGGVFVGMSP